MKFALLFALLLLLTSCSRDAKLHDQIIGTWTVDNGAQMTLAEDGGFVTQWASLTRAVTYQGTWKVRDGSAVSTITNCTAQGTTNIVAVGSVERYAILRLDRSDLVLSNSGAILSFKRN